MAPARVVLVRASAASGVVRERVHARGLQRDGAKLAAWDEFWARYGDMPCLWRGVDRQIEIRTDAPELDLTSLDAVAGTLAP
ncbi:hypothetical protein GCM10025864_03200 [Luteimicrobium album]|uniref:Uncharacterized protein n=1 Tax=Luteimicrobium album TaxID=1054550 RepID=A0ABQ6HX25_9MICO|nr:hypothetical protein [Luteimicrobium album]GMA22561.1 hypothetical protein GCM10025864_03200 [Luteimicrobium album]